VDGNIFVSASQQIPRLTRTFNLNFQDFPGLKILQKIQGLSRMRGNPEINTE